MFRDHRRVLILFKNPFLSFSTFSLFTNATFGEKYITLKQLENKVSKTDVFHVDKPKFENWFNDKNLFFWEVSDKSLLRFLRHLLLCISRL